MFLDRYLIFTSIPFFMLISIILWKLALNHKSFYICSLAVLLAMVFHFDLNPDNNRRVGEMTNEVKRLHTKGTPLLICPDYFDINLMFYYDQKMFIDYENFDSLINDNSIFPLNNFNNVNSEILESDRIIFVDAAADFSYPNNNIVKELNKRYARLTRKEFKQDLYIYYFENRINID